MSDYKTGDYITDEDIKHWAHEVERKAFEKRCKERDSDEADETILTEGMPIDGPADTLTDDQIREELKWVRPRIEEFLKPYPRDFDDFIQKMKGVAAFFGQEKNSFGDDRFKWIETAEKNVATWEGALATNFTDYYLRPIPTIVSNQGKLAHSLYENAWAMKSIYQGGRQDARDIAKQAVEAIDAIKDVKGIESLKILLAAVIAATAIAGPTMTALAVGGNAAQLANAGIAAGSIMGGPFMKEGKELPLGANTVEEVLKNMDDALKKVEEKIKKEEDTVIDALKKSDSVVYPLAGGDSKKATELVPMLPKLLTATKEETTKGMIQFPEGGSGGNSGNGNGGGRGSWVGDNPPPDWDGSVFDPPGDNNGDKVSGG